MGGSVKLGGDGLLTAYCCPEMTRETKIQKWQGRQQDNVGSHNTLHACAVKMS